MKLTNRMWKNFHIAGENGVFNLKSSSCCIDKNKLKIGDNKKYPYVTRSDTNNGISLFISGNQEQKNVNKGNVITIGLDTQTVFYQSFPFYTGQNIHILECEKLNKFNALFIIPLLKKQLSKFNWGGNGATQSRILNTQIVLPVNSKDEIDWNFMENYIKEKIERKEANSRNILNKEYENLKFKHVKLLKDKVWKSFLIEEDLFDIYSGKDIYDAERNVGNIPYVSSTSSNNGIGYFVSNKNLTIDRNVISINRNGSVGYAFYHRYDAIFSNDCRKLKLKNKEMNQFIGLFLVTQIRKQREKYNFGYKMGTNRLSKQKVLLPVDENERPDYTYMEQYMKNLFISKVINRC